MNIAIDAEIPASLTRPRVAPHVAPATGEINTGALCLSCCGELDDDVRTAWTHILSQNPQATIFHEPGWCTALQRAFGHAPRVLLVRRNERPVGVLPLMLVRGLLSGQRLISQPCATYGGILADGPAAAAALSRAARQAALSDGVDSVELRGAHGELDEAWTTNERHVEFVRELPTRVADLDAYLPRKARAAARQAEQREGLRIRHDGCDIDMVWNLYARSMRRLGSLNYPRSFFHALYNEFRERTWITAAWKGTQPVAAVLSFVDRGTIRPYFAGVDERVRCTGWANLLYRGVMQRAIESGLATFDFGRTRRDNRGVIEFKKNQGFEPRALIYRTYTPIGRRAADLSPSNPRFAFARRVWPRLPLSLTRPLGAWLSRSLPG